MLPDNYQKYFKETLSPGIDFLREKLAQRPAQPTTTVVLTSPDGATREYPIEIFEKFLEDFYKKTDRTFQHSTRFDTKDSGFLFLLQNKLNSFLPEDEEREKELVSDPLEVVVEKCQEIERGMEKIRQRTAPAKRVWHALWEEQIKEYNHLVLGFPDKLQERLLALYGEQARDAHGMPLADGLTREEIASIVIDVKTKFKAQEYALLTLGATEQFLEKTVSTGIRELYEQKYPEESLEQDRIKNDRRVSRFTSDPFIQNQAQELFTCRNLHSSSEVSVNYLHMQEREKMLQLSEIIHALPENFITNTSFVEKLTSSLAKDNIYRSSKPEEALYEHLVGACLESGIPLDKSMPQIKAISLSLSHSMTSYHDVALLSSVTPYNPLQQQAREKFTTFTQSSVWKKWVDQHQESASQDLINRIINSLELEGILIEYAQAPTANREQLIAHIETILDGETPSQREYERVLTRQITSRFQADLVSASTPEETAKVIENMLYALPADYQARLGNVSTLVESIGTKLAPPAEEETSRKLVDQLPVSESDRQLYIQSVLGHQLRTARVYIDEGERIANALLPQLVPVLAKPGPLDEEVVVKHLVDTLKSTLPSRLSAADYKNEQNLYELSRSMLRASRLEHVDDKTGKSVNTFLSLPQQNRGDYFIRTISSIYETFLPQFYTQDNHTLAENLVHHIFPPDSPHTPFHPGGGPPEEVGPPKKAGEETAKLSEHVETALGSKESISFGFFRELAKTRSGKIMGFLLDVVGVAPGARERLLTLYFTSDKDAYFKLEKFLSQKSLDLQRKVELLKRLNVSSGDISLYISEIEKLQRINQTLTQVYDRFQKIGKFSPTRSLFSLWSKMESNLSASLHPLKSFHWFTILPNRFSLFLGKGMQTFKNALSRIRSTQLSSINFFQKLGVLSKRGVVKLPFGGVGSFFRLRFQQTGLGGFAGFFRKTLGFLRVNFGTMLSGSFRGIASGLGSLGSLLPRGFLMNGISRMGSVSLGLSGAGPVRTVGTLATRPFLVPLLICAAVLFIFLFVVQPNMSTIPYAAPISGTSSFTNVPPGPSPQPGVVFSCPIPNGKIDC